MRLASPFNALRARYQPYQLLPLRTRTTACVRLLVKSPIKVGRVGRWVGPERMLHHSGTSRLRAARGATRWPTSGPLERDDFPLLPASERKGGRRHEEQRDLLRPTPHRDRSRRWCGGPSLAHDKKVVIGRNP
jgi:hypothetical protein